MNIQKSRLAAILSAALMVCMMVTMFVVPASAAEVEEQAYYVEVEYTEEQEKVLHDYWCSQCDKYSYLGISECGYMTDSGELLLLYENVSNYFMETCSSNPDLMTTYIIEGEEYVIVPSGTVTLEDREFTVMLMREIPDETEPEETEPIETNPIFPPTDSDSSDLGLTDVVTPDLFNMVLDEVVSLLPIVIPVMIGFIGLRKGISFLQSVLHSA